jgi:pimeloyl-ACP methyl ester carboxylesterase
MLVRPVFFLSLIWAANASAEPPPLIPRQVLLGNPQRLHPLLSPDGKWLAYLAHNASNSLEAYLAQLLGGRCEPEGVAEGRRAVVEGQPRAPEGELRRRAMFGAQLAAVTEEVRNRHKLEGDEGVLLEKVFPGTSAAEGNFKEGDVILAIGGEKVTGVPAFLEKLAKARAGDVLVFAFVRDGVRKENRVTLMEMLREKGDGYDVIYSSVTSHGARLRTIITRPKAQGRHPAVMLLQGGHTCFPVDTPAGQVTGFTWIASDLTRHGYVTMRIERPGCGDSEGGPLRDVDFDTELDGLKQALRELKKLDFVDADNVFLFGHSMGGVMAPLMALEVPVRGIAVYGTTSESWFESVFGQRRRLASLDGTKLEEVDREILDQARFWYPLLVEKKTPREIHEQRPELPRRVYEQWVKEDKYVFDRHYRYYHQVADRNLSEAWAKVAAKQLSMETKAGPHTRVLAIWGTTDWLSTRSQHTWIAEVVNRVKPGNGKFVALDAIDHFFFRAATPEESYRLFKPARGARAGEFNPVILETIRGWLNETAGKATKEPGTP